MGRRVLPQRVVGLQVRLVAAVDRQAVVAQKVGLPAAALTDAQRAAVHLEHALVQHLVQDGCGTPPTQRFKPPKVFKTLLTSFKTCLDGDDGFYVFSVFRHDGNKD